MENLGRTTSVVSDVAFSVSSAHTEDIDTPQSRRKNVRIADRIIVGLLLWIEQCLLWFIRELLNWICIFKNNRKYGFVHPFRGEMTFWMAKMQLGAIPNVWLGVLQNLCGFVLCKYGIHLLWVLLREWDTHVCWCRRW